MFSSLTRWGVGRDLSLLGIKREPAGKREGSSSTTTTSIRAGNSSKTRISV
ncbi:hypothetical protein E2C01_093637 [Portunus trituberculatus]|uniref:Uncharacterized protein n=1 Tax=Portunus trituberculatus TaxID=210409 RepID=A0A5B7JUQ3_PORTR|nr:hypothetical protein [Portunus trituberculatus]